MPLLARGFLGSQHQHQLAATSQGAFIQLELLTTCAARFSSSLTRPHEICMAEDEQINIIRRRVISGPRLVADVKSAENLPSLCICNRDVLVHLPFSAVPPSPWHFHLVRHKFLVPLRCANLPLILVHIPLALSNAVVPISFGVYVSVIAFLLPDRLIVHLELGLEDVYTSQVLEVVWRDQAHLLGDLFLFLGFLFTASGFLITLSLLSLLDNYTVKSCGKQDNITLFQVRAIHGSKSSPASWTRRRGLNKRWSHISATRKTSKESTRRCHHTRSTRTRRPDFQPPLCLRHGQHV
mmetsp:Transcript_134645/g.237433  ORF Transcript_134645/g.237433 Transcript_134645/m.237433 type:complete len:295 (-) Transcript_134645:92-976(-)